MCGRGMTFQGRKLMGRWIEETAPSKRLGEDREGMAEGKQSLRCHSFWETSADPFFFNVQPYFRTAFSCCSLHRAHLSTLAHQYDKAGKWSRSQAAWTVWIGHTIRAPRLQPEVKHTSIFFFFLMWSTWNTCTQPRKPVVFYIPPKRHFQKSTCARCSVC